jgi:hypothetical protein
MPIKKRLFPIGLLHLLSVGLVLTLCACADGGVADQPPSVQNTGASNFENSSEDNNGVEPMPNNGSQDFGRRSGF